MISNACMGSYNGGSETVQLVCWQQLSVGLEIQGHSRDSRVFDS